MLGFGQEKIPQTGLARHGFEFFDDGDGTPAILGDLVVIQFFVGINMLLHERGDAFLKGGYFRRMVEVH